MPSLYQINAELETLIENGFDEGCVDIETGEVLEEAVAAKIAALQLEESAKKESLALYVKNLQAESDALSSEEKKLRARREKKERKVDFLKRYLTEAMLHKNETKFETSKCSLSFRRSEAIVITSSELLISFAKTHTEFLKPWKPEVEKVEIKKALKSGQSIPGARLEQRQNLQVK